MSQWERRQSARAALAKLREAREGGVAHRLHQLDLDDAERHAQTEDQYQQREEEARRQDGTPPPTPLPPDDVEWSAAFLVGDEGIGYLDETSPQRPPRRRKRSPADEEGVRVVKKPSLGKRAENGKEGVKTHVLIQAQQTAQAVKKGPTDGDENAAGDDLLTELVGEIDLKANTNGTSVTDSETRPCGSNTDGFEEKAQPNALSHKDVIEENKAEHMTKRYEALSETVHDVDVSVSDENKSVPFSEDGILPFFFLDADDSLETQGVVSLLGKVAKKGMNECVSCCVRIRSVERVLFLVPKEGTLKAAAAQTDVLQTQASGRVSQKDILREHLEEAAEPIKKEALALLRSKGVKGEIKIKVVQRNYAFDHPPLPHGLHHVLKVTFQAKGCPMLTELSGRAFHAVLAMRQSLLESVLLRRKVMGPMWIALKDAKHIPTEQHRSWCSVEVEIASHKCLLASHKDVCNRPPPKLRIASIQLETVYNQRVQCPEIVMATVACLSNVSCDRSMNDKEWNTPQTIRRFHALTTLKKQQWPSGLEAEVHRMNQNPSGRTNGGIVTLHDSERLLLMYLLQKLCEMDPDVLVGHEIASIHLNLLLHRMQHNKVEDWSRIGRLKRSKYPAMSRGKAGIFSAISGRLLCDTFVWARESLKEVEFSLTTLAKTQFGETRREMNSTDLEEAFNDKNRLMQCMECSQADALLTLRLMFHLSILPLTKQLTNLSGNIWNKTLQAQKAQRIDMLLMHEFHNRKFMLPEKPSFREKHGSDVDGNDTKKTGPQYAGGMVIEPKVGLYDDMVLLLDFKSLYPSIIQEFKLCFTTVDRSQNVVSVPGTEAPNDAPLPTVIKGLVDSRRQVKKFIAEEKDPVVLQQRKIREQALKLTANSMYGCLGFHGSRFSCQPLAELITKKGRDILEKAADLVTNQLQFEVVYGDTDSIMINTGSQNYQEVRHGIGEKIKRAINKDYRTLEIDVDGIFQPLLLLKKKKYAAMKLTMKNGQLTKQREERGLDIVRRDWSKVAKSVGTQALQEILSGRPLDEVIQVIHTHLRDIRLRIDCGEVPLSDFEIVKELAKHPEEYPDSHSQPHVLVALRRKQEGHRDGVQPGQAVRYVICTSTDTSSSSHGQADRAYHPDEIKQRSNELSVDKEYYLGNQIHAVVSRLCDPLEGTDAACLAECLGLDRAKFAIKQPVERRTPHMAQNQNRFLECKPLMLSLAGQSFPFCGVESIVDGTVTVDAALKPVNTLSGGVLLTSGQIENQVTIQVRQHIAQYLDGRCKAEDEDDTATRVPHYAEKNELQKWTKVITERKLYYQLVFWVKQMDIDAALLQIENPIEKEQMSLRVQELRQLLPSAFEALKNFRDSCEYGIINFQTLLGLS